ncbi:MAG: putative ABC transporter ATP-binding protein [Candidatus Dichloromethanomonas elyunquensis]|nr:MAG: putative ABC transporter ATP-binding protein [Candidatus Dichloromethanomonas elyunquensis]
MSENRPPRRQAGGFGPGPMVMAGGQKAKDFKGTMKELINYMTAYKTSFIIVLIFAVFSSVFSIVGPKILGKVTTKLFEGLIAYRLGTGLLTDFDYMRHFVLLLVTLYLISSIFSYLQNFIMSDVSMKITYQFRKDISEKINRMPLEYFDKKTHGEVLSRITNDVDTVSQTLNQSLTQIIFSVTTVIGVLTMMLSISWIMTLVALLVMPASSVIVILVVKKSQQFYKTQQKYLGHINGQIEENYSGHNIVQVFNGEKNAIRKFKELNEELYDSAWKSQFLSSMMMPIISFVGNIGYVAVCILGGYLAVKRIIEVGDIQAFIQYMRSFTQPLAQLSNISNILQSTAAAAERVFEFLNEKEASPDPLDSAPLDQVSGHVEFKNVKFGYREDKIVINDFSANIEPGQMIAIVGPTGAGKSTVVKLLMRFYDINEGEIYIDGHEIYSFSRDDLRSLFGMVLQDTWLYNTSILENIRYGSFDKSDQQVFAAAKAAHCDEFIKALPDGYHLVLNEEASNISQGQKQLLTIARTILADPKILILDEATSSVDTRTELLIQKAMANLMKNRTSFVIAHRLSTIRDADLILVMKDGDIIEQGKHEELLAQSGFYAELYQSQFSNCE